MGERVESAFRVETTGSHWLLPVSDYLCFPLDQVNFLACQLFGLAAAFWFRLYLSPSHANPLVRHSVAALLGVVFLIFCFGWYSAHILTLVLASYLIIINADINNVHRYSMVTAMGYLTACQVSRVFIYNYGVLSTDFSGPLMIVTQKITTLAFQLHDGMCKKSEQLTSEQKPLAINVRPSLIEYLSYNLNFMSVFVGPCSNYKEYIDFIEGRHIRRKLKQHFGTCNGQNGYDKTPDPSPLLSVFSAERCLSEIADLLRLHAVPPHARPKFYFAWTIADAVNNAAGYGFSGLDENGKPSWDLICNLNILGIETATSFKAFIDNWNIQTGIWLKTVCYDRAPKHRLALTFFLSALWHGVYPGYYFTFITAIPITMAARAVRTSVRHYFLGSRGLKLGYDILTWAATQLAICYTVMPFLLLAVEPTLVYYRSMYFHVHIISILAAIALHWKHKPSEPSAASKTCFSSSSSSSSSSQCSAQGQPVHSNNNTNKVD
ncbi:lysophospholipid acyltransferase 1 isoform X3 [Pseudoliparis swirei]|uniref:lysophospholipid acyltransferase 1 isoform X3 n=1 Tax=Pseudoliparis swirei TaxID=2059687 RepID=UPI0024BD8035|nr:lysophospholipid acyltransferase 1 isoform X3 [Pseudoliparis swirei]